MTTQHYNIRPIQEGYVKKGGRLDATTTERPTSGIQPFGGPPSSSEPANSGSGSNASNQENSIDKGSS